MARMALGQPAARFVAHSVRWVGRGVGRLASAWRTRALFPGAPTLVAHWSVEFKFCENIEVGEGVVIGPGCTVGAAAPVVLGDGVHLSKNVLIETAGLDFSGVPPFASVAKPISVGRGVWLGAGSAVLGGVAIGEGSVIGAGAVVRHDVPPHSLVTGGPCRITPLTRESVAPA